MATTELPASPRRASRPARWPAYLRKLAQAASAQLRGWAVEESARLALWAPVAIGAGAGVYLGLKSEPPTWAGPLVIVAAGGIGILISRARLVAVAAGLTALGFVAADWRADAVAAPALARETRPVAIVGRLAAVDEGPTQRRLIVDVASIEGIEEANLPARVRVNWRGEGFDVLPGDRIGLRAGLSPPPPPLAPGGFDFARQLYFQRIGAVGFAVTAPARIAGPPPSLRSGFLAEVEKLRLAITRRIQEAAPGQGGAFVAAAVTGKRGAISPQTEQILRDSGLAHLVAISGLNMGLATGIIFFSVRALLAAIEPVALSFPIKKWAAAAALLAGALYLLLAGGGWSASRACIMTSIFFVAIVVDRRALSLRNVAIAATFMLLTTPEAVLHPGFQMSFAAVTALIAAYEWAAGRADPDRSFSVPARIGRYVAGVAATDIVAALATAPYSLFHFGRSANYGLAANLVSIPIMGFWIMPTAIAGLILMPFGFDGWAWRLSAKGVDAILAAGGAVAPLAGAVTTLPHWPLSALILLTGGGLWLCLQSAPWRLGGLASVPVAALLIAAHPPPALFVSPDGDNAAILAFSDAGAERLALFNPRKDKFAAEIWKEFVGLDKDRAATVKFADVGRCDAAGCVAKARGATIAVSVDPLGLADDCARADLVVALYPVSDRKTAACAAKLIDRGAVWDFGAHAVWIAKDGTIRIETVGAARGRRPWTGG